jgi:hypothetical protein
MIVAGAMTPVARSDVSWKKEAELRDRSVPKFAAGRIGPTADRSLGARKKAPLDDHLSPTLSRSRDRGTKAAPTLLQEEAAPISAELLDSI